MLRSVWWLALLSTAVTSCSDELSLSDYERYDVGVWFGPPDGADEVFLGVVHGANACGVAAYRYAASRSYQKNWGYVCCTHRNGSDCYEKIRYRLPPL